MKYRPTPLLLALAVGACSAAPGPGAPEPRIGAETPDPVPEAEARAEREHQELVEALDVELITAERRRELRALGTDEWPLEDRLAGVALDEAAPTFARGNALLLLGRFGHARRLDAFGAGVRSDDPEVRAAAAAALGDIVERRPEAVIGLLALALRDSDPWVQTLALQSLSDHSPDLLREFLTGVTNEEVRGIALQLLRVAEQRGAPLAGTREGEGAVPPLLERETEGGHRVVFRAERLWNGAQAAEGRLSIVTPDGRELDIAAGVEVVAGVIPAFLSPDERYLVYESARTIHVRDLRTGEARTVGPGIAPRTIPYTGDFIFLRPRAQIAEPEDPGVELEYDVLRESFERPGSRDIGGLAVRVEAERHGNYSPVRWMHVREQDGRFVLAGEQMMDFELPSPFDAVE